MMIYNNQKHIKMKELERLEDDRFSNEMKKLDKLLVIYEIEGLEGKFVEKINHRQ